MVVVTEEKRLRWREEADRIAAWPGDPAYFQGNTKVLLENRKWRSISAIKVGSKVLSIKISGGMPEVFAAPVAELVVRYGLVDLNNTFILDELNLSAYDSGKSFLAGIEPTRWSHLAAFDHGGGWFWFDAVQFDENHSIHPEPARRGDLIYLDECRGTPFTHSDPAKVFAVRLADGFDSYVVTGPQSRSSSMHRWHNLDHGLVTFSGEPRPGGPEKVIYGPGDGLPPSSWR